MVRRTPTSSPKRLSIISSPGPTSTRRIGLHGSSLGGYSGPALRHRGERIKAVAVWSGANNLVDDIFHYYPPIRDRLRWLMGAKDLKEAGRNQRIHVIGRADKIECPLSSAIALMTG